jgi:ornithine decarboxylase
MRTARSLGLEPYGIAFHVGSQMTQPRAWEEAIRDTLRMLVIGTAERGGNGWLHLDVGAFNGMMEALLTRNRLVYPLADSRASEERRPYHITGPTCDSQDTMFFGVALSHGLVPGDQVYIDTAGAYTTCDASAFNGFGAPTTYCVP